MGSKDGLCGLPSEVYLETLFDGKSKEEANAAATRIYIQAYNNGERLPRDGACAAADVAWKEAWRKGEDPVLQSALAFMNAWPGVQDGNPCAVAGVDYVKAVLDGNSHLEANKISMTAFADAFKTLARKGKALKDPACRDATKASMPFQRSQTLPMPLRSMLSWTRSSTMMLLLLILSAFHRSKNLSSHTMLGMIF